MNRILHFHRVSACAAAICILSAAAHAGDVDPFGGPVEEAPAAEDPFGAPEPAAEPAAIDITEGFFAAQVWPIFEASCVSCHGDARQRGALRLDSPRDIRAGGAGGEVLTPGNPDASTLYTLTILPEDHPDIMPATGDPLTPEQTEIIRQWILDGADFGDWDGPVMASVPDDLAPAESAAQFARPGAPRGPGHIELLAQGVEPAPQEALAPIQETGALAMPLARDNNLIRIDFNLQGDKITDEHLELLAPLAGHITWLNLARTQVTDDGLAKLAELPKLTRLHLEHTAVSDAGLAHLAGLEELRYLNLFNTSVSDAGLEHIAGLPNLERLFLWQTQATPEGAEKILAARPDADINLGWELDAPVETADDEAGEGPVVDEAYAVDDGEEKAAEEAGEEAAEEAHGDEAAAQFDEGSCCAVAVAAGTTCDHPCCVEATAENRVCEKCNPTAAG